MRTTWCPGRRLSRPQTIRRSRCWPSATGRPGLADAPLAAVLAIDGGNSKTDVALIAPDGTVLAAERGPGANHEQYGVEQAMRILDGLVRSAAAQTRGQSGVIARHTSACLAGADLPEEEAQLTAALRLCRWSRTAIAVNDTFAVLRAGLSAEEAPGDGDEGDAAGRRGHLRSRDQLRGGRAGRAHHALSRPRRPDRRLGRRRGTGPAGDVARHAGRRRPGPGDRPGAGRAGALRPAVGHRRRDRGTQGPAGRRRPAGPHLRAVRGRRGWRPGSPGARGAAGGRDLRDGGCRHAPPRPAARWYPCGAGRRPS